jgi:NADH-quinone oxidoreductase subunit M
MLTIIAATAVVLTAGYMLWTLQRIWLGKLNEQYAQIPEINGRELFTLLPLAAIVIVLGVYPTAILNLMSASLDQLNQVVTTYL